MRELRRKLETVRDWKGEKKRHTLVYDTHLQIISWGDFD